MQTEYLRSIPKLNSLLVFLCLFILIFSIGKTSSAQNTLSRPEQQTAFNIVDFDITMNKNEGSDYSLTIKAVTMEDVNDFTINGPHIFTVDKDTQQLYFTAGRAITGVDDISDPILIKYLGYAHTVGEVSDVAIEKLYHFSDDGKDISKTHIPLWQSLLPPLIAILMALIFKEVIISLFAGIWLGAFILYGFDLTRFFHSLFRVGDTYLLKAMSSSDHAAVILFSLLIGGMVAIISRNGGMAGIVQKLSKYASNSRNTQLITWGLGVGIFFDDYANTLIVGNTMRPVTDRFRISREKLAYIVDSTAAPVAAIAFVTTWIGAELGYIDSAINQLGLETTPYSIFLGSLKYSFYPILTLIFIVLIIFFNRDFGPMRKAEMRARETGEVYHKKIKDDNEGPVDDSLQSLDPVKGIRYRWTNAFFPIITVILVTIIGLMITGHDDAVWDSDRSFFGKLTATVGNADSFKSLIWGSSFGLMLAIILSLATRTLSLQMTIESMMDGFKTMLPAIIILVLAWSIAELTIELHTADFLTKVFSGNVAPQFLPAITFVMAALISFSTGSSWSTMAIMYPLILPTTWILGTEAGMEPEALMEVMFNTSAVVLGGSVLGDHCSPISDTTVLSSLATKCNHIDHVRTQLPYALTIGVISLGIGGFLFTLGWPWYVDYLIGIVLVVTAALVLTKKVPMTTISINAESAVKKDNQSQDSR